MSEGIFPDERKKANMKPVPKSTSAREVIDYRPLALTSAVSKYLERLLFKIFQPFVSNPDQFAYYPGRSTEDALLLTKYLVSEPLDTNSKSNTRCLFVDFTSAFSTIHPTKQVNRLTSTDLYHNLLNWPQSYLNNRQQKVITQDGTSSTTYLSISSRQGCLQSPVIFSIHTD